MRVQIFLLLLATLPLNSRQTILGNGTFFGEMSDGATSGMHSFMELFAPVTRLGHSIMNFFSPRDDEEELGTTTVPTTDPLPRSRDPVKFSVSNKIIFIIGRFII